MSSDTLAFTVFALGLLGLVWLELPSTEDRAKQACVMAQMRLERSYVNDDLETLRHSCWEACLDYFDYVDQVAERCQ